MVVVDVVLVTAEILISLLVVVVDVVLVTAEILISLVVVMVVVLVVAVVAVSNYDKSN